MEQGAGRLAPEFWSSPVVASALASCDAAALLEEIRRVHGWSQKQLALAVGYSQSWVSNVLRRRQVLTVDQVREVSRQLGIPVHLLRFGDAGSDDQTRRRDFGKAMALALVPLPMRAVVDETTAPAVTAITGAQRRLDATTSSRELARGVAAHVEMANRLFVRAQESSALSAALAAAVSEAAGFAAWLHGDMHDVGTARIYYRLAIDRARRAGQGLLAGYMLGSLAAFEIEGADPGLALPLVAQAREQVGVAAHPTPRAWLDAIEALSLAACRNDGRAADSALLRAEKTIEKGDPSVPPPWPWVYPFDHVKLAGYRALVSVSLGRAADALAAFAESLPAAHPAPKQRAMIMLEVATAARQDGESSRDGYRVDQAFQLAREGLAVGLTYSSERVVERARRSGMDTPGRLLPACVSSMASSGQRSCEGSRMRRIAVSGHRSLPARTVELIDERIRALLSGYAPDVVGVSCLADGADQVFALAVRDLGGRIEVIVPAERYREGLSEDAHEQYDRLFAQAVSVRRLPFSDSTSESHMAASKLMVDEADELYAVWDGKPARGYGGTADVVAYARDRGTPVRVIWPDGAERG